MRSRSQNNMTPEDKIEYERLCKEAERFNRKGLFDTVHHEILGNMEMKYFGKTTLGRQNGQLNTAEKETRTKKDEVTHGKSDL